MAYKGFDLDGKVSLITGGNGGIGFGMADALAEAGADICIWGTNPTKNAKAAEKLKKHGRKVHTQIVDVGDEKQVAAGFAETLKVMGHVDNCVANAGVSGRGKGSILEMDYEEWRRVTRVNLDGVFFTFRAAAKHMVERGKGGSLVAMASTAAIEGAARSSHYGASKGGVCAMVRALAVELARYRITVNSILPGWIWMSAKIGALSFFIIWLRATYPRLREDQLQRFAWIGLIPLGLADVMLTGVVKVLVK